MKKILVSRGVQPQLGPETEEEAQEEKVLGRFLGKSSLILPSFPTWLLGRYALGEAFFGPQETRAYSRLHAP
jgi:hypothetical protein